ncbi:hypothetical protein A6769_29480 [Nostoc punctiforme NIES-2108]|uniref:Uncharacterized protein n=1 Tax=Nostoc punctiforme NIES-2108 TaxID=1356359 RepID=A0A367R627_NOSPU|nr:hypothetical protein A6769_29480 [Nostoc punctiforme NIES-2108]
MLVAEYAEAKNYTSRLFALLKILCFSYKQRLSHQIPNKERIYSSNPLFDCGGFLKNRFKSRLLTKKFLVERRMALSQPSFTHLATVEEFNERALATG